MNSDESKAFTLEAAKIIYIKPPADFEQTIHNLNGNLVEIVDIKYLKNLGALDKERLIRIKPQYQTTSAMLADEIYADQRHFPEMDNLFHILYGAILLETESKRAVAPKPTNNLMQFRPTVQPKISQVDHDSMRRIEDIHVIPPNHRQHLIIDAISTQQDLRNVDLLHLLEKNLHIKNGHAGEIGITKVTASPLVNSKRFK